MTADAVIKEIKKLLPNKQSQVLQFVLSLVDSQKLTGNALSVIAQQFVNTENSEDIEYLKFQLVRGFFDN